MPIAFGFGSGPDWFVLMVVALIVFGPKKLPEVGRQLGQAMREFRKMADELTGAAHSVRDEVESAYKPMLTSYTPSNTTTSATVQHAAAHQPYDQTPEDLMAPAHPELAQTHPAEAAILPPAPLPTAEAQERKSQ